MHLLLALLLAVQQGPAFTTPPSGDTTGYWQQHVAYRIVAVLDERAQLLHSEAELVYVNHSPDTLHQMYVHQYLNAFRPGSKWSAADEREGRVRFQHLPDPYAGFGRFTSAPTFDGVAVHPDYPGAPDSTVAHFTLPRPLPPGDSVRVHFAWDARPSVVPRRQGRRGRHYDFAQWYPKVAVYDRGGWEENPLVPAGELYGEFGTYDVTMIVPRDQVIGASGVLVSGDPGWARVKQWGTVNVAHDVYPDVPPGVVDTTRLPAGYKAVRFYARRIHHFAWSTSPDYMYEGGLYDGRVALHVLYRPGDEAEWGHGQALHRMQVALHWLESIYGRYGYPQLTALHRIEGGGTEFPMMVMLGGASQGLILHEVGHIYSYGMLANNEWRSGWMDEGLTSYQTAWEEKTTLPEQADGTAPPPRPGPSGYRGLAVQPQPFEQTQIQQYQLDLLGRAEPIGTKGQDFNEFGIYNAMIYTRASLMYGALRDVMGDSAFTAFLQHYYAEWQFKHVDEVAMRDAAQDIYGKKLGWFFDQWVYHTGLIDYALAGVQTRRDGAGWLTRAHVVRRGRYRHPMPVGARTSHGWAIARGNALADDQWVEIHTDERPSAVRIDPTHLTEDWDRRNDVHVAAPLFSTQTSRYVFDWPFLDQASRNRNIVALTPLAWYSDPGGVTPVVRMRTNYQGWLDRRSVGLAIAPRVPGGTGRVGPSRDLTRLQGWATIENPRLPFASCPTIGLSAGIWALDGVSKVAVEKRWDASPFLFANGPRITWTAGVQATAPYDWNWVDGNRWEDANVVDATVSYQREGRSPNGIGLRLSLAGGYVDARALNPPQDIFVIDDAVLPGATGDDEASSRGFGRAEAEIRQTIGLGSARRLALSLRGFGGVSTNAPLQRSIGLSALDATQTFGNDLLRPKGAPLARSDVHFVALGGAGLHGYSPLLRMENVGALNAELDARVTTAGRGSPWPDLWVDAFADGAWGSALGGGRPSTFSDAGLGVAVRGNLFDRAISLRFDLPFYVQRPVLAVGSPSVDDARVRFRWTFSFNDLW
ncbi:MAG TPA: M1 family metallopeptidase [Gemmatimonadaceae bacterium]|nr:M1 family metallopeptidase [Gemmatimonadaceae bacterium]